MTLFSRDFALKIYHCILDYILPRRCMSCAELTQDDGSFCASCWQELEFITKPFCTTCGRNFSLNITEMYECLGCIKNPPDYNVARSIFKFNERSKKVVHAFKYYDHTIFATNFAKMLYVRYEQEIADGDVIVPVPMHKFKRLLRMYNQSALLASELAKLTGKTVKFDVLIKSKWTKPQTFLTKKNRLTNIAGSITVQNVSYIKNKNIILIDDVMTTGTTVSLCSRILKKAGAKKVTVLCIAST